MEQPRISTTERMVSAGAGSLLTSLFVTPLDVIKVRLQAQAADPSAQHHWKARLFSAQAAVPSTASVPTCSHYEFSNGLMEHMCSKQGCPHFQQPIPSPKPHARHYRGAYDAFFKIIRHEGPLALWTGLPPTLVMAVPATVLYFTAYDEFNEKLSRALPSNYAHLSPLVCGGAARVVAATVVSPIELARTQMQSMRKGGSDTVWRTLRQEASSSFQGFLSLWRGLVPTLWRDVPFSMLYWEGYEIVKKALRDRAPPDEVQTHRAVLAESFVAGLVSGMAAAAVTTPLDVVKTRVQIQSYSSIAPSAVQSMFALLRDIYRAEKWPGLFVGLGPRVARVAPSCAIMISTYELGKHYFSKEARGARGPDA